MVKPKNPKPSSNKVVKRAAVKTLKKAHKKPVRAAVTEVEAETEAPAIPAAPVGTIEKPKSDSPYQLDHEQVLKASRALLKHISSTQKLSRKPNLLADDPTSPSSSPVTIWLNLTTKKYIADTRSLKPKALALTHALRDPTTTTICLITADPQRHYKDLVSTSPTLSSAITKVVSISKLKAKFKSFESRRALAEAHDMFLADDRVTRMLPGALGSAFYKRTNKVPVPIQLAEKTAVGQLEKAVKKALGSTYVHLSPSAVTSVRVALSNFSPEQVAENVRRAVEGLTSGENSRIPGGWRNLKSLHIKGPETAALPIWLAETIYGDEEVLQPEEEKERMIAVAKQQAERKERKEKRKALKAKRKGLLELEVERGGR